MAFDPAQTISDTFRKSNSKGFKQLNPGEKDMVRLFILMSLLSDPQVLEDAGLADKVVSFFGLENFSEFKTWQQNTRAAGSTPDQIAEDIDLRDFDFEGTENALLDLIGDAEHSLPGSNYNTVYGNGQVNLTSMTINEVLAWQDNFVASGSPSSAAGRYQFIRKTLAGLRDELGLSGDELFDEKMQDRLAVALLERRGYNAFINGEIGEARFMKNLSQEWASLPKNMGGASYYAGDGLNKALVTPQTVLAAMRHARHDHEERQNPAMAANPEEGGLKASFAEADHGLDLENPPDPRQDISREPEAGPNRNV